MAKPSKELTMERDAIIDIFCTFDEYYRENKDFFETKDAYIIAKLTEGTKKSEAQRQIAKGFIICLRGMLAVQEALGK